MVTGRRMRAEFEVVETRCLAWVLLYPHGEARVVTSVA
jgi:hypothetical protein